MGFIDHPNFRATVDPDDPDDYRPNSQWAVIVDSASGARQPVRSLAFVIDRIAPGDRVPLHVHQVDEAVFVQSGDVEVTVGEETRQLRAGATIFIAAGTAHGASNTGTEPCDLLGVFPTDLVTTEYKERNPSPGTEKDPPQPLISWDLRADAG